MKPYWFLCIREGITAWSLLARILVMIFIEQLRSEMGLKSEIHEGLAVLGTRVMKEELILWRQVLLFWKAQHRS